MAQAGEKARWGEEVEEQDYPKLPRPKETVEDGKKIIVSYSRNGDGKIEKKTQVFRTELRKEVISEAAAARRSWKKFGVAKGLPPGPSPATTSVGEDVFLELKSAKQQVTEAEPELQIPESTYKCRYCEGPHLSYSCPYKSQHEGQGAGAGPDQPSGLSKPKPDDSTTVRVSNLSDDIEEKSLRTLFSTCGYVNRVFIVMDRTPGKKPRSRGFAFVSFSRREEAQQAIEKLNGQGFDYMILRVEFAQRDN